MKIKSVLTAKKVAKNIVRNYVETNTHDYRGVKYGIAILDKNSELYPTIVHILRDKGYAIDHILLNGYRVYKQEDVPPKW